MNEYEQKYLDEIKPFDDSDVKKAISKLIKTPLIYKLMSYIFPSNTIEENENVLISISDIREFQSKIIYKGMKKVIETTLDNLSFSGLDNIEKNQKYLFISNHRDIVLDPSLFNVILFENGFDTTQIAIGDNLIKEAFTLTLAKLNKTFIIKRNLAKKESILFSKSLSHYINDTLKKESIWIAQREGRSKDGKNETNKTLIKMLSLCNQEQDIIPFIRQTNIVPLSISYEYDPTDYLKAYETTYNHTNGQYKKKENEDFESILKGINGYKKNVHIHIGEPLNKNLHQIDISQSKNDKIKQICSIIDSSINNNYKIWHSNLIAYDILNKTHKYKSLYSESELNFFTERMNKRLQKIHTDTKLDVKKSFLNIYANSI